MKLLLSSLFGRAVLVLILGLAATHLVSMSIHYGNANHRLALLGGDVLIGRIVTTVEYLRHTAASRRAEAAADFEAPNFSAMVGDLKSITASTRKNWRSDLLGTRLTNLFPNAKIISVVGQATDYESSPDLLDGAARDTGRPRSPDKLFIEMDLPDIGPLLFSFPKTSLGSDIFRSIILEFIVMWFGIVALSLWAARWLIHPLKAFGLVAETLGKNIRASVDDPAGPDEIRQVARALNEMQARLRRFIEDRTFMLASISHDLRTPITRLRLRAEFVEDTAQRNKMLADLDDMERMTESTLTFTRDEVSTEKPQMVDMTAILQSICSDMLDSGHAISLDESLPTPISGRPLSLKRGFTNLITNAVACGKTVWVHIREQQASIVVEIEDDGPGVPNAELENIFAPFYRIDKSRNTEIAGTGLGLAVARSIFRGHGGDVRIENRDKGGLRATVTLPR